jgi:hypothetical protein
MRRFCFSYLFPKSGLFANADTSSACETYAKVLLLLSVSEIRSFCQR